MSKYGGLKKPGSSKSSQRLSWGPNNVVEFSKETTPSKLLDTELKNNLAQEEELKSPLPSISITPIHSHTQPSQVLSPVSEESFTHESTQNSSFYSQENYKILKEIQSPSFPEIRWKIPEERKSINRTPRKSTQFQRTLSGLKEIHDKSNKELKMVEEKIGKFIKDKNAVSASLARFSKVLKDKFKEWKNEYLEARSEYKRAFEGALEYENICLADAKVNFRWDMYKYEGDMVYKHKRNCNENEKLADLMLICLNSKFEIELISGFEHNFISHIWKNFKVFMTRQRFNNDRNMLEDISNLWCFFIKFSESFSKIEMSSTVNGIQCTEEYCMILGSISDLEWKVIVNFHLILEEWDVFSRVQNYFKDYNNNRLFYFYRFFIWHCSGNCYM